MVSCCNDEVMIAKELRAARVALGISQSDMAISLGIHQSNVSRFESPNYTGRTMRSIVNYAKALGCDIEVIVGGDYVEVEESREEGSS